MTGVQTCALPILEVIPRDFKLETQSYGLMRAVCFFLVHGSPLAEKYCFVLDISRKGYGVKVKECSASGSGPAQDVLLHKITLDANPVKRSGDILSTHLKGLFDQLDKA